MTHPAATRRTGWLAMFAGLAVVVALITALILTRGGSAEAQELVRTQTACQVWVAGYQAEGSDRPVSPQWCSEMVAWMRAQFAARHMSGAMMWSSPEALRNTCQAWVSDRPRVASRLDAGVCDAMVGWMTVHEGNWNQWMMTGRGMMGG